MPERCIDAEIAVKSFIPTIREMKTYEWRQRTTNGDEISLTYFSYMRVARNVHK